MGWVILAVVFIGIPAFWVWHDIETTRFLREREFFPYRLDLLQTVKIVPGKTYFLPVKGQKFKMGYEFLVHRDDGSVVVLKMTLWMGMLPIWVADRIEPPEAEGQ